MQLLLEDELLTEAGLYGFVGNTTVPQPTTLAPQLDGLPIRMTAIGRWRAKRR